MLLYIQVFFFVAQFIPFFGFVTIKFGMWLPYGSTIVRSSGRASVFDPDFSIFQLLTYSLLNPDLFMLLFNLLGIYTCAQILENHWGEKRFFFFYIICVLGDALLQLLMSALTRTGGFVFGSAGPMFGLLMAMMLLHRDKRIDPPWLPNMQVTTFVIGLALMTLLIGKGAQSFLVQFTHLVSGALFGWLMLTYWRKKEPLYEDNYDEED